jgi:hypothetical protein
MAALAAVGSGSQRVRAHVRDARCLPGRTRGGNTSGGPRRLRRSTGDEPSPDRFGGVTRTPTGRASAVDPSRSTIVRGLAFEER